MDFYGFSPSTVDSCWYLLGCNKKLNNTCHQEDRGRLENGEPTKQWCGNKGYRYTMVIFHRANAFWICWFLRTFTQTIPIHEQEILFHHQLPWNHTCGHLHDLHDATHPCFKHAVCSWLKAPVHFLNISYQRTEKMNDHEDWYFWGAAWSGFCSRLIDI